MGFRLLASDDTPFVISWRGELRTAVSFIWCGVASNSWLDRSGDEKTGMILAANLRAKLVPMGNVTCYRRSR